MARVFKLIYLKNGNTLSYDLEERRDGFYITATGQKERRISTSTRNWMQAEIKFDQFFKSERKRLQQAGTYARDSDNYSGIASETHTSTFKRKPNTITALKRYGMKPYYLEFSENIGAENQNGQWFYDKIYYAISWYPTSPITLNISKKTYRKHESEGQQEILSDNVREGDAAGIKQLVEQFKKIYAKEKEKMRRK